MEQHYELTYTISKNLSPEDAAALLERISSLLPNAIQTEKGQDFFSLEFYSSPAMIEELENKIKLESQVKKHLIVKKLAMKAMKVRGPRIKKTEGQLAPEEQKTEKVELKEIDKKLKEIFDES